MRLYALVALVFLAALCYGQNGSLNQPLPPPCEVIMTQQGGPVNYVAGQYMPGLTMAIMVTPPPPGVTKCAGSAALGLVVATSQVAGVGLMFDSRFYRPVSQSVLRSPGPPLGNWEVTVVTFEVPLAIGSHTATLMVNLSDTYWGPAPGQWLIYAVQYGPGWSSTFFERKIAVSGGQVVHPALGTAPEVGAVVLPTQEQRDGGVYWKVGSLQLTQWSGGPATLKSVHLKFDGPGQVFLVRNGVFITPIQTTEANGDVTFQVTQPVEAPLDVYAMVLPSPKRGDIKIPQIAAPLCTEDMLFLTGQGGFVLLSASPRAFRFK